MHYIIGKGFMPFSNLLFIFFKNLKEFSSQPIYIMALIMFFFQKVLCFSSLYSPSRDLTCDSKCLLSSMLLSSFSSKLSSLLL